MTNKNNETLTCPMENKQKIMKEQDTSFPNLSISELCIFLCPVDVYQVYFLIISFCSEYVISLML